jgi:hypothetical protein
VQWFKFKTDAFTDATLDTCECGDVWNKVNTQFKSKPNNRVRGFKNLPGQWDVYIFQEDGKRRTRDL